MSKPKKWFTLFCLAAKVSLCVVLPLVYLFVSDNAQGAFAFIILLPLWLEYELLDAHHLIQQLGHYGTLGTTESHAKHKGLLGATSAREFAHKSRFHHIHKLSRKENTYVWERIVRCYLYLFVVLTIGACLQQTSQGTSTKDQPAGTIKDQRLNFQNETYFAPIEQLFTEPVCSLALAGTSSANQHVAEYLFLCKIEQQMCLCCIGETLTFLFSKHHILRR